MILLIFICWLICSVLSFGFSFAYLHREYPSLASSDINDDFWTNFSMALSTGPIFLIVILFSRLYIHGLKYDLKSEFDEDGNKL